MVENGGDVRTTALKLSHDYNNQPVLRTIKCGTMKQRKKNNEMSNRNKSYIVLARVLCARGVPVDKRKPQMRA